ncbi:MAG TPA: Holliday junction resolvase RuvX [Acidimicrobiales bacterium]|nr:Holliday junction resolvase RuvX [Acidimicrobiales bacterium]
MVGLDLGERRIGVAVSDSGRVLASPHCTIERARTGPDSAEADRAAVVAVVTDLGAEQVVVGMPLGLDGRRGRAGRAAADEAAALSRALEPDGVAVTTFDERFTTVSAERALAQAGHSGRSRRQVVDQAAAAVMLQAWLDSGHRR